MLFVALMLWLTYLGDKQEKKKNGDKLDEFLDWRYRPMNPSKKSPKNGNISQWNETTEKTFTRHDLVEYIYWEKIDSSSSEYKTWGRVLRDAVADGKITSDGKNRSWWIKYKKK